MEQVNYAQAQNFNPQWVWCVVVVVALIGGAMALSALRNKAVRLICVGALTGVAMFALAMIFYWALFSAFSLIIFIVLALCLTAGVLMLNLIDKRSVRIALTGVVLFIFSIGITLLIYYSVFTFLMFTTEMAMWIMSLWIWYMVIAIVVLVGTAPLCLITSLKDPPKEALPGAPPEKDTKKPLRMILIGVILAIAFGLLLLFFYWPLVASNLLWLYIALAGVVVIGCVLLGMIRKVNVRTVFTLLLVLLLLLSFAFLFRTVIYQNYADYSLYNSGNSGGTAQTSQTMRTPKPVTVTPKPGETDCEDYTEVLIGNWKDANLEKEAYIKDYTAKTTANTITVEVTFQKDWVNNDGCDVYTYWEYTFHIEHDGGECKITYEKMNRTWDDIECDPVTVEPKPDCSDEARPLIEAWIPENLHKDAEIREYEEKKEGDVIVVEVKARRKWYKDNGDRVYTYWEYEFRIEHNGTQCVLKKKLLDTYDKVKKTVDPPAACEPNDAESRVSDWIYANVDSSAWFDILHHGDQGNGTYKVEATVYYRWVDGDGIEWERKVTYTFILKPDGNGVCLIDSHSKGAEEDTKISEPPPPDCSDSSVYTSLINSYYSSHFPEGYSWSWDVDGVDDSGDPVWVGTSVYYEDPDAISGSGYGSFDISVVDGSCKIVSSHDDFMPW